MDLSKMSQSDARVELMKDVAERLRTRDLLLDHGAYCQSASLSFEAGINLQPYVDQMQKECEVCALGGLFLSHIRLFNEVQTDDNFEWREPYRQGKTMVLNRDTVVDPLLGYFDTEELNTIEYAFELGAGMDVEDFPDEETCDLCFRFSDLEEDETQRVRLIAEYIVKHGGAFDLEDLVESLEAIERSK